MLRRALFAAASALAGLAGGRPSPVQAQRAAPGGSVIFFHPDGMGLNHWGAVRMHSLGPDGRLNWDRLPAIAVYLGHMRDALTGTSNGGATTHAFGVRVAADSFGAEGATPIRGLSGFDGSIAKEALARGKWVGLVNSGGAHEPGTAAFFASVARRSRVHDIVKAVAESGVQLHLAGGERYYLPRGVQGRHGEGTREDGLNLVQMLRERGYAIVYTREELAALPANAERVWGIFAHDHSFSDRPEEELARDNRPLYLPTAPSIAEMSAAALRILSRAPQGFLLVAEEEGTDNFANVNNAAGQLEAGRRADEAVGIFAEFVGRRPNTLFLTCSDSDAGGMQVLGPQLGRSGMREGQPMREREGNGAPLDGPTGTASVPFMAPPDREGRRLPFGIVWATRDDVCGGILVRGAGAGAEQLVRGTMENVDIYRAMYRGLFGTMPG